MSIAKGQDKPAEDFLQNIPISVRLAVPSICYLEALTTLEQEEKYNKDFMNRLNIQINESERDTTSQNAKLLRSLLDQARVSFNQRTNDIEKRFYLALNQLYNKAEMITLNTSILQRGIQRSILEKHIIDKLILEFVIHHASLHPNERKVFLSGNSKEFGQREVTEILQNTGVQYFKKIQDFLSWLRSQTS